MIFGLVGFGILYAGERNRPNLIAGIACFIACLAILSFAPAAIEQSSQRRDAMENNILIKYNAKYGNPTYLNAVEYNGAAGRSGGDYFKVTYADGLTERIVFRFNSNTGEPRCDCDLEKMKTFETAPEFKELFKRVG